MAKHSDFNPQALTHPCMQCEYGHMWTEQMKPAGNYCLHREITVQKGRFYGRFHTLRKIPSWCPQRAAGKE